MFRGTYSLTSTVEEPDQEILATFTHPIYEYVEGKDAELEIRIRLDRRAGALESIKLLQTALHDLGFKEG